MTNWRRIKQNPLFVLLVVVIALWVGVTLLSKRPSQDKASMSYETFLQSVEGREVEAITLYPSRHQLLAEFKDSDAREVNYLTLETLEREIRQRDPNLDISVSVNPLGSLAGLGRELIIPFAFLIALWVLVRKERNHDSRLFSFGSTRPEAILKERPKTTFADVAALDEAVEELLEIKEFLSDAQQFNEIGAELPRGILLVGPPGVGKTLLGRSLAGEAGVPFYSLAGSDFVELFIGVGAARVRDLFERARADSPAIIFIDELDAIGRQRGSGLGGGHDEREHTLNQLLIEMDGFSSRTGVIVVAATNRPDILDPALLRPGRFDRRIVLDRPDVRGREQILQIHAQGKSIDSSVDFSVVARMTAGFTGADLANVLNEAALLCVRYGKHSISQEEIEEAIDRVISGPARRSRVMSQKDKELIAHHEAGHALVAWVLPNTPPLHRISLVTRGRSLGQTLTLPIEERFVQTKEELLDQITWLLGGRAAEEFYSDNPSTSAEDDLERATKIARKMVCQWGMSEALGPWALGRKVDEPFVGRDLSHRQDYSDSAAEKIDLEIQAMLNNARQTALRIIQTFRGEFAQLVEALLRQETLQKDEIEKLLSAVPKENVRTPLGGKGATARTSNTGDGTRKGRSRTIREPARQK